jgi:hypothetical protein
MMIRRVGVAAVCAGALVCGLAFALPAMAQSGTLTVVSAGSPQAHAADLSVTLEDTSSEVIGSSISVGLYPPHSSTPALTLTDFTMTSGTNSSSGGISTWSETIPEAQLQLGMYTIAVQASDTAGNDVDIMDAGTLAFIVYPTLTLSVSPTTVSYGQTVTVSGTDMGLYPDGSTGPVVGQEVIFPCDLPAGTTDSSGNYSITLQAGIGAGLCVGEEMEALANATTAFARSNGVTVKVVTDPLRLTGLSVSPATVSYPGGFSFSGTLSYEVGGTWRPWTGTAITVSPVNEFACDTCIAPGPWGAVTNDGSFKVTVPGPMAPDTYDVYSQTEPWFADVSLSVTVRVDHVRMVSTSIKATLSKSGYVSVYACGQPDAELGDPPDMAPFPRGTLEYSARSWRGPWKAVRGASVKTTYGPPTHFNGCDSAKAKAPGRSDYYRIVTPANAAYQAMSSAAIKAKR